MGEMLQQGARFPKLELSLVGGGTLTLPDDSPHPIQRRAVLPGPLVTLLPAAVGRIRGSKGGVGGDGRQRLCRQRR